RDTADIREEIDRLVPLYRGIAALRREGDSLQWGGERLFEKGFEKMPGRRARFWVQDLPVEEVPEGAFLLTTRRGKQFNSMVHGARDSLTGMRSRDVVFVSGEDLARLGIAEGERVRLRNDCGEMLAVAARAEVKPR